MRFGGYGYLMLKDCFKYRFILNRAFRIIILNHISCIAHQNPDHTDALEKLEKLEKFSKISKLDPNHEDQTDFNNISVVFSHRLKN